MVRVGCGAVRRNSVLGRAHGKAKTSGQKHSWLFMEEQGAGCSTSEGANGSVIGRRGVREIRRVRGGTDPTGPAGPWSIRVLASTTNEAGSSWKALSRGGIWFYLRRSFTTVWRAK